MKREFLIDRQGKQFVLYAGLLDAAHDKGLKSIRTQMLQAPSKDNGEMSIFRAVVEMEDGRVFEGTGDATPANVGRNIIPHAMRMAETRAKARALRDALNIGGAALEELGGDHDDEPVPGPTIARPQPPSTPRPAAPDPEMLERQRQARAMNPPAAAVVHPAAQPGRDPALLAQWSLVDKRVTFLRQKGIEVPVPLPSPDADAARLDKYVLACQALWESSKPKATEAAR